MRSVISLLAVATLLPTNLFGQDLAKQMVARVELLNSKPCIHVIALQDDFSASREGTDFALALSWHSYVQGVADTLYPGEEGAFQKTMTELIQTCLTSPDQPMSEIAQIISLLHRYE